ncbi:Actin-like protein 10 [Cichlidogyrus casuarinus]|uniref:Actin-like protein 10 n=1 Tax=Cichlidogyrus casuarinus TaxID=1844966 RepID=A0ABD2PP81_9PLAT
MCAACCTFIHLLPTTLVRGYFAADPLKPFAASQLHHLTATMSDDEGQVETSGKTEAQIRMEEARKRNKERAEEEWREYEELRKEQREKEEEEIRELRERRVSYLIPCSAPFPQERRKKERQEEETRLAGIRAEEEAKRKADEEERQRKKRDEDQRKKEEREKKRAEFEAKSKTSNRPNFVINKKAGGAVSFPPYSQVATLRPRKTCTTCGGVYCPLIILLTRSRSNNTRYTQS